MWSSSEPSAFESLPSLPRNKILVNDAFADPSSPYHPLLALLSPDFTIRLSNAAVGPLNGRVDVYRLGDHPLSILLISGSDYSPFTSSPMDVARLHARSLPPLPLPRPTSEARDSSPALLTVAGGPVPHPCVQAEEGEVGDPQRPRCAGRSASVDTPLRSLSLSLSLSLCRCPLSPPH